MNSIASGDGTARSEKIALTNVRVFDGRELRGPTTVVIEGGIVGNDPVGARVIDAGGTTLLPGLIDAHVHLLEERHLQQLAAFGVTTALDMGAWPPSMVDALRNRTGMADIRSAGIPATTAGSAHSRLPGYPAGELVDDTAGAARFVADRIAEGADYIKLIADIPGPDQETLDAQSRRHTSTASARSHTPSPRPPLTWHYRPGSTWSPMSRSTAGSPSPRRLAYSRRGASAFRR